MTSPAGEHPGLALFLHSKPIQRENEGFPPFSVTSQNFQETEATGQQSKAQRENSREAVINV